MSLLTVVQNTCAVVGVTSPQAVVANITANRTMQEMLALANEMAQRIAYDSRDWQKLILTNVFTGDGVTTSFPMPANYKRMLLNSNVWSSANTLQPMTFISDADEWMQRRASNWSSPVGEWTILGGKMLFWPALGVGATASFAYLDGNCINLTAAVPVRRSPPTPTTSGSTSASCDWG